MVQGLYQRKPPFPFVVGTDAAGEVIEIAKDIRSFTSRESFAHSGVAMDDPRCR